jgi:hypothetical protein
MRLGKKRLERIEYTRIEIWEGWAIMKVVY